MAEEKENEDELNEEKQIADWDLPLSFTKDRHTDVIEGVNAFAQTRLMNERMNTANVALVLCLNVGVDPPDIVKAQPCAQLECWIDPFTMSPATALEQIGSTLQKQYEIWQPIARYKQSLDPTVEEVKKLCTSLRRSAKEDRILFHYNGHGVPKPTVNGDIWVCNGKIAQYDPVSVYDLQTWMGAPSIYVYDCSCSGIIVDSFRAFADQRKNEFELQKQASGDSAQSPVLPSYHNCIQLAACGPHQILPMHPDLPADMFTACLTTPIKIALRWHVMHNARLMPKFRLELLDIIPGQLTARRTMLGEINWIFTAITDTIAWNTLPIDLFQKLFREDLLVSNLFRNFLLADRILRSCNCTPVSSPALLPTYQHAMWQAWDHALDLSLSQLPGVLTKEETYVHLPFFEEQLTAFQVWLSLGSEHRQPPEQLPIVLQILLSQVHRLRALELLARFMDLGPWAINVALSVGIFPYLLKLLKSSAKELRPLLVFIWAKIIAVDSTSQADLVQYNGFKYFLSVLQDPTVSSEHCTLSAFVLASIVHEYPAGQKAALQESLVSICLEKLGDPCKQLRQWLAICLAQLWDNYGKARWTGVRDMAHEKLYTLLQDPSPDVRAAAVYALGTLINSVTDRSEHPNNIDHSIAMTLLNTVSTDMSCLVRQELVVAIQWIVLLFENSFLTVALQELQEHGSPRQDMISPVDRRSAESRDRITTQQSVKLKRVPRSSSISSMGKVIVHHAGAMASEASLGTLPNRTYGSVYVKLWNALTNLDSDPHPEVAKMSRVVTDYIRHQVKEFSLHREIGDPNRPNIRLLRSPNRRNLLPGESPGLVSIVNSAALLSHTRKLPNTITEKRDVNHGDRKPLVQTRFVAWACKHFAQPVMRESEQEDVESSTHYEREWRYMRNSALRKEAREEQERVRTKMLKKQVFNARHPYAPHVLQFHPYEQQIAVAGKDSFSIWDWGTGEKIMYCVSRGAKSHSKLTALEWVNGHDVALMMVASDDGTVKLWRPTKSLHTEEPILVSAWHALSDVVSNCRTNTLAGTVMAWEQWTQTLVTSGDVRYIRLWDAERELKSVDIPTGADCSVSCIDSTYSCPGNQQYYNTMQSNYSSPDDDQGLYMKLDGMCELSAEPERTGLIAVGCADGSVRLFDRRLSTSEARVRTWRNHNNWVIGLQLRGEKIISGSSSGDVGIYDIRQSNPISSCQVLNTMSSFAINRSANGYACGSSTISIHNLSGQTLNTIRFYEGFMGHRIRSVSCLAYHPHRMALAAGTNNSRVTVYCIEQ